MLERKLLGAVLGAPFFAYRAVLLGSADNRVIYPDDRAQTLPSPKHLHFNSSVSVKIQTVKLK
ncbi:hypothetical protein GWA01_03610 [Gluconobacter wancherniae NBRC 103581]|uniref:Uncharacterized protein n=1 Tax=Gluconobacter wancherniae NBRC 103581 TaxID=656744 RepID=A0A511AZI4_9PROT|nr:hypothetical protein GWA01_03610 [Gluconobacter wancherniae NBRC 103581]